jgi:hypothetical protein
MKIFRWWVLALALMALMVGCGGGDEPSGGVADSAPPMDAMARDAMAADALPGDASIPMPDSSLPDACAPSTCTDLGLNCGFTDNGCGDMLDCGSCVAPESCGGGGTENVCGCMPSTCGELAAECGDVDDGCGTTLDCGSCTAPESCGGGGVDHACGCMAMALTLTESAGGGANDMSMGDAAWRNWMDIVSENASDGFIPSGCARVRLASSVRSSQWLVSSAHGFMIPSGATINGIEVDVRRRARSSSAVSSVRDGAMHIVRGGVISTTENKAVAGDWTDAWTYITYGGPTDLWGLAWTPDDINAARFGAALRTVWSGRAGNNDTFVDHIRIRVHYTSPPCP